MFSTNIPEVLGQTICKLPATPAPRAMTILAFHDLAEVPPALT